MQFQTKRFFSNSGDRYQIEYFKQVDEDGHEFLKECGKNDLYDEIQSHAASVDIHNILARYAAGDVGALSKYQGMYGDFSKAPTSLVEVIQMVNEGERAFMELPLSVREQFGNSLAQWLAEFGSDVWNSKMGFADAIENVVEETVEESFNESE